MNNEVIIKKAQEAAERDLREMADEELLRHSLVLSIDDILNLPVEEEQWIVRHIVLANGITIVSGLPGTFKSLFTQILAKAVASGSDFLGKFPTQKGNVLIIDREVPTKRLRRRWSALGDLYGLPIYFFPYSDSFKLDNPSDTKRLNEEISGHDIKLVVIDTFNRVHSGRDIGLANEVAKVFEPLKELLETTAVILVHHSNKGGFSKAVPTGEELLGSIDFLAEIDLLFTLRKTDKNSANVHNLKSRDSEEIEPFSLTFTAANEGRLKLLYEGEVQKEKSEAEVRRAVILDFLKSGKRLKAEIVRHTIGLGYPQGTIENDLTFLRGQKLIGSKPVGKEAYYFLLENYRENEHFPDSNSIGFGKQGNVAETVVATSHDVSQRQNETSTLLDDLDHNALQEKGVSLIGNSSQTGNPVLINFPKAKDEF